MNVTSLLPVALLISSSAVASTRLPHYPIAAESYTESSAPRAGTVRVKVSIFSEKNMAEQKVRLGGLIVCSTSACFRPDTPSYVDIPTTSTDERTAIADFSIPPTTITEVYFSNPAGGVGLTGKLAIKTPLTIGKNYHGGEILVVVSKRGNANKPVFIPVDSATGLIGESSTSVHYIPGTTTIKSLPFGATITLPRNALNRVAIFDVTVRDVGNKFPQVGIFPSIELSESATLETPALPLRKIGTVPATPMPEPIAADGASVKLSPDRTLALKASMSLKRTGVITSKMLQDASKGRGVSSGEISPMAGDTSLCLNYLNNPANISLIESYFPVNGVVYVNWCENIPPYISMAYVNMNDVRIYYELPTFRVPNVKDFVYLKRINEFGPSIVSLNGFTWKGDYGMTSGGTGKVLGFMQGENLTLGQNVSTGGTFGQHNYYAPDGDKFVISIASALFTNKAPYAFATGPGTGYNEFPSPSGYYRKVVSSSTSVVANGYCQSSGGENRWSAMGIKAGRMLLTSSTSTGTTSAAQLCPIFKAFGINNALRLDGGASTAMLIDGVVKNPLEGSDYWTYGTLRRIAYPLRVSY